MQIAAILSYRIATGLTRPLRALRSVVGRLDRGDLGARANEQDGPSEVRALARAVNAVGRRARAEAIVDRDAEVFRQRTRLIASTIRRTTNGNQMAERTITVSLQNEDHTAVVQTWKLLRARIIKHISGPFNAKGTDVAMEELTIAYERLEME